MGGCLITRTSPTTSPSLRTPQFLTPSKDTAPSSYAYHIIKSQHVCLYYKALLLGLTLVLNSFRIDLHVLQGSGHGGHCAVIHGSAGCITLMMMMMIIIMEFICVYFYFM